MTIAAMKTINILLPRNNTRDVLAAQVMLSAIVEAEPFTLCLVGRPHTRLFQLRGSLQALERAKAQLRHAYPQCDFEEVDDDRHPLRTTETRVVRSIELRLREPAYLPIRTAVSRDGRVSNDDFAQGADPMLSVLAAMDGLMETEECRVEITLQPMAHDWSKYWRGATSDVGERAKLTPTAIGATLLMSAGATLILFGLLFLFGAILLHASLSAWLLGIGLLVGGGIVLYSRFQLSSPPDPILIKQKINATAFRALIRLTVHTTSAARVAMYLDSLVAAYRAYNLAGGNGFVAVESSALGMVFPPTRTGLLRMFGKPWSDLPILNTAELAALWHLPHGEAALQGAATTTAKSLLPLPSHVTDTGDIHIGEALHQGERIPVHLSRDMLAGNIGLVAKTQSGKSNLMALITAQIIASDPDAAVIVIDPHRRLAETVASLVPPARQAKTIFLSLADREHPFGLNLLDRRPRDARLQRRLTTATEMFADKMTSDIIETLREIWTDNWGPRMENYLRWPLLTLAHANERMIDDFAFSRWRLSATQVMRVIHPHLVDGQLDNEDFQMIDDLQAWLAELSRPGRVTAGRVYDALSECFSGYRTATGAMRALVIEQLYQIVLEAAQKGDKPTGISRRLYGKDEQPLQFTLLDVMPLQMSSAMRTEVRGALNDVRYQHIQEWWRNSFETYRSLNMRLLLDMITPVLSKLDRFNASDVARRIFGQPDSTLDVSEVLDEGGVLLVDLAAGVVGQDTAALIGSTLMNWIASILFSRQAGIVAGRQSLGGGVGTPSQPLATSGQPPRRVFIVIDEFQSLPGVDYAFMLSELSKYGAQLMMGTQSLGFLEQVNQKTRTAWLDNTSTLFVFRCGSDDARSLADELSITDVNPLTISPSDIVGLPDYTCYVRTRDGRGQQQVFQAHTHKAPSGSPDVFTEIQTRSRNHHCRSAQEADALIALAQSLRGEPDLGISRSAGWHASETGGKQQFAVETDAPAQTDMPPKPGEPDQAKVKRVRKRRANDAADALPTLVDADAEAEDAFWAGQGQEEP